MEFAPMRQQVVGEGVLRMRDAVEFQRQAEGSLGVTRVTLAHGAFRRHEADLFVH